MGFTVCLRRHIVLLLDVARHDRWVAACLAAGAPAWLAIGIPTVPRKGGTDYLTMTIGDRLPFTFNSMTSSTAMTSIATYVLSL